MNVLTDPEYWKWAVENGYIVPHKVEVKMREDPEELHVIQNWKEPRVEPRQDELD